MQIQFTVSIFLGELENGRDTGWWVIFIHNFRKGIIFGLWCTIGFAIGSQQNLEWTENKYVSIQTGKRWSLGISMGLQRAGEFKLAPFFINLLVDKEMLKIHYFNSALGNPPEWSIWLFCLDLVLFSLLDMFITFADD